MSLNASLVSQTPSSGAQYTDPAKTYTVTYVFQNTGTESWSNTGSTAVKLGTNNPDNRASGFGDNGSGGLNTGWADVSGYPKSRILMQESSVTPGNNGTFTATFRGTPEASWRYNERFRLVKETVAWFGPVVSIDMDMRRIGTTLMNWAAPYRWGGAYPVASANRTTDTAKLSGGSVVSVPDGPYDASDPDVAYRKLELLKDCGFNLLLLNWNGHGSLTEFAALAIIDCINNNSEFDHFRYCFFTDQAGVTPTGIYDYLYSFHTDPHYFNWNNKPLMTIWGAVSPPSDSRMSQKRMGANDTNLDWHWEVLPVSGAPSVKLGGTNEAAATVIARYDDRKLGEMPWGRPSTQSHNPDLNGTLFTDQFGSAKTYWQANSIRALFINAWDEYHERVSLIEPHDDASVDGPTVNRNSAVNSPTYLFDLVKTKIAELK